jgi:cystathionine beta-synthase
VGLLDESDLLVRVIEDESRFREPAASAMTSRVETVPCSAPMQALLDTFERGYVAVVVDGDRFLGIITRIDLLNHLRRRMK